MWLTVVSKDLVEMLDSAEGAKSEPSTKRKKSGSQIAATARHLYPTEENQMFCDQVTTTASHNCGETENYGHADLSADMADIDEFAFWNDMQRCETLLGALSSNLEICKENMNPGMIARMAEELEKVASLVNNMS